MTLANDLAPNESLSLVMGTHFSDEYMRDHMVMSLHGYTFRTIGFLWRKPPASGAVYTKGQ